MGGEREKDRRRPVVDAQRGLAAEQLDEQRDHVRLARSATAGREVELDVRRNAGRCRHRLDGLARQRRAAEIRVEDDPRRVQHTTERWREIGCHARPDHGRELLCARGLSGRALLGDRDARGLHHERVRSLTARGPHERVDGRIRARHRRSGYPRLAAFPNDPLDYAAHGLLAPLARHSTEIPDTRRGHPRTSGDRRRSPVSGGREPMRVYGRRRRRPGWRLVLVPIALLVLAGLALGASVAAVRARRERRLVRQRRPRRSLARACDGRAGARAGPAPRPADPVPRQRSQRARRAVVPRHPARRGRNRATGDEGGARACAVPVRGPSRRRPGSGAPRGTSRCPSRCRRPRSPRSTRRLELHRDGTVDRSIPVEPGRRVRRNAARSRRSRLRRSPARPRCGSRDGPSRPPSPPGPRSARAPRVARILSSPITVTLPGARGALAAARSWRRS